MTSKIEKEVNEIRLRIYEEIKDMTSEEQGEYFRRRGEACAKKHGFKVIHSPEELDRVQ
jgi:succinylglutamate desuccinylase